MMMKLIQCSHGNNDILSEQTILKFDFVSLHMMKNLFFIILLFAGLSVSFPLSATKIIAEKVGSKINITVGDKYFTSYIFSEDEKYPFFYPVNGPASGGSVTSMRNGEYPHHSSLFFGCDQVNGGNYWQEGLERGRIISLNAQILKQGGDTCNHYR